MEVNSYMSNAETISWGRARRSAFRSRLIAAIGAAGVALALGACGGGSGTAANADDLLPDTYNGETGGGDGSAKPAVEGRAATLSWAPPTERLDGEPLAVSDIAGYRIYYGPPDDPRRDQVAVEDPTLSEYRVTGLTTGTYSFTVTALDTLGQESGHSNALTKAVN